MTLWKQAVASAVLVAAAVGLWARYFPSVAALVERTGIAIASVEADGAAPPGEGRARAGPPLVVGAEVVQATINDSVSAIGDGRAARSVTVTPYVSGRIVAIEAAAGDYVAAGAALARLDAESEAIALDRARINLDDARATLARFEELTRSNAVSEVQRREAELALRRAELALRDAELALERRVVRAPFDGWVGILTVEVGDQVSPDTEIVTLDDRSRILVDFRVPERFVGQLAVGAPASARPLARPGVVLDGEIVALDSRISADTRTIRVRASLDNSADLLRAGMAFSIALRFDGETYPAVDPLAIQWGAIGSYVWTGRDGVAAVVPVRIIQRNNDYVLVEGDLAPGELVVTEGMQMLRGGAPFTFEAGPEATARDAPAGAGAPPAVIPAAARRQRI